MRRQSASGRDPSGSGASANTPGDWHPEQHLFRVQGALWPGRRRPSPASERRRVGRICGAFAASQNRWRGRFTLRRPIAPRSAAAGAAPNRIGDLHFRQRQLDGPCRVGRWTNRQNETRPQVLTFNAGSAALLARIHGNSDLAKACGDAPNCWGAVSRFLADGRVASDSDTAEPGIKPGLRNHSYPALVR